MCGFTGFIDPNGHYGGQAEAILVNMRDQLSHRGPDDCGIWQDAKTGVFLSHRRLAIQDLSPHGHQPMLSPGKRYVISFNGEIYNFPALRKQLQRGNDSIRWQGHSDTEVLLVAIESWGLDKTLQACVGMFAFALWDRQERMLYLVRDRLGEKPLYYGYQQGVFLFASELKALKPHPAMASLINRDAIALLFRHSYIPAPYSIYQGIEKLLPGHYLRLDLNLQKKDLFCYWSLADVVNRGQQQVFSGNSQEALDHLEFLLQQAITGQSRADVALGAFLSGGIDSSLVVALMQKNIRQPVKTFSIGFSEKDYNEAEYAKTIANHLGTQHTELYVTSRQIMEVIPKLPFVYDEPFADPSGLPTFLLAEMTRQQVSVSLSGDGGDELFGGYTRYRQSQTLWRYLKLLPTPLRIQLGRCLQRIPARAWQRIFSPVSALHQPLNRIGDRIPKLAEMLAVNDRQALYRNIMSFWQNPADVVAGAHDVPTQLQQSAIDLDFFQQMMYLDSISYLPDDILTKVDRAAMAVSLETRIPLLDHRLVEFAWSLPQALKIRNDESKGLLRQIAYRHIPRQLLERPKAGFAIPLASWLRQDLRPWAEDLLDATQMHQQGFLDAEKIQIKWREHVSGSRNWHYYLWNVLMFQLWLNAR